MSREEQEINGWRDQAIIGIHLHQFLRWSGDYFVTHAPSFGLVLENYMLEKERWHYVLFELSDSGGTASTLWISSEVGMGILLEK